MSAPRYRSPAALETAINDRINARFPNERLRRRTEVAFRRLLARLYEDDPNRWLVKGGVALILRLDPNRTSNDIDLAYLDAAGEHVIALKALDRAMARDLGDFFSFERTAVGDETPDRARRITVRCRLGAREFATFRADLALPRPDLPGQPIRQPPQLTGIPEIDDLPPVLALAWPQQIAEKVCAMYEVHRGEASSRARDLADLAMISRQITGLDGEELVQHLRAEVSRRPSTLPEGLPVRFRLADDRLAAWRDTFERATRSAPIAFADALDATTAFVDPMLSGIARGRTWIPASAAWVE